MVRKSRNPQNGQNVHSWGIVLEPNPHIQGKKYEQKYGQNLSISHFSVILGMFCQIFVHILPYFGSLVFLA